MRDLFFQALTAYGVRLLFFVHHLLHVGVDHGIHHVGQGLRIVATEGNLEELTVIGEIDEQLIFKPTDRIGLSLDERQFADLGPLERRIEHVGRPHRNPLAPFIRFKFDRRTRISDGGHCGG